MESGLLLDVAVGERESTLEVLSGKNQALLIGRDSFLVRDLRLHIIDRVG